MKEILDKLLDELKWCEQNDDFLRRVAEWTNKYTVNDLRAANYGVVGHMPVIFDYAGYLD